MNKREKETSAMWLRNIKRMGFTDAEANTLRLAEKTLHRWHERECNGEVEIDDNGKAWAVYGANMDKRYPTANRYAGCLKRLDKIFLSRPGLAYYVQGDPRGCALYVYRLSDLGASRIEEIYSSVGVCYPV